MARERIHPSVGAARLLIVVAALCTAAHAVEFAGGTGHPNDPYQIATAQQLMALGEDPNLCNRHFVLIADINLDPNLPDGQLLMSGLVLSTGSFDGGGHSIINLALSSDIGGRETSGLFEAIGPSAIVRNLSVEGTSTHTASMLTRAGLLASRNEGLVINCQAQGALSIPGGGGLVADNLG